MGGHGSHPLGWTALVLVVVAYAHVILELAVALLAVVIAARIVLSPALRMLVGRLRCEAQIGRRAREVSCAERATLGTARAGRAAEPRSAGESE